MLYITVHLYGKNGTPGEFKDYESKALKIFRQHGGEVIIAYTPVQDSGVDNIPDEIQILRIENRARLEVFMKDPERVKMAEERNSVIKRTDIFISEEIINYFE